MEFLNEYDFAHNAVSAAEQKFTEYIEISLASGLAFSDDDIERLTECASEWSRESMLETQILALSIYSNDYDEHHPTSINTQTGCVEVFDDEEIVGTFEGFYIHNALEDGYTKPEPGELSLGIIIKPFDKFPGSSPEPIIYRIPIASVCEAEFYRRDHPLYIDEEIYAEQKEIIEIGQRLADEDIWFGDAADILTQHRQDACRLIGREMLLLVERDNIVLALSEDGTVDIIDIPILEPIKATMMGFSWSMTDVSNSAAELAAVLAIDGGSNLRQVPLSHIYAGTLIEEEVHEKDQKLLEPALQFLFDTLSTSIKKGNDSMDELIVIGQEICDTLNNGAERMLGNDITLQTHADGKYLLSDAISLETITDENNLDTLCLGEWFSFEGEFLGYVFDYSLPEDGFPVELDDFDIKAALYPKSGPFDFYEGNIVLVSLRDIANSRLSRSNYN